MPTASPMQSCGIQQCRTKHRTGFIVELADESVSHVGRHCGKKHFGTAAWKVRLRTYREAAQAGAQSRALAEARESAVTLLQSPISEPSELSLVRKMLAAFDGLPPPICDSLIAKAQDNKSQITRSRPATEKEIKDAKFYGKPRPSQVDEVIGNFASLKAILPSRRADHIWDKVVPGRFDAIRSSLNGSTDEIATSIRNYQEAFALLTQSIREALSFFKRDNLAQLPLLQTSNRLNIVSVTLTDESEFKIELKQKKA